MVSVAAFTTAPLSSTFLASFDAQLAKLRTYHLKATLRFTYNDGGTYPSCPEAASLSLMLQHISQLAPYFQKYSDVILGHELGFFGCWGEGSGSSKYTTSDKAQVVAALLNASPGRMVMVRYPDLKAAIYGTGTTPMTLADAFGSTNRARTAHYNDCLLSTTDSQDLTYQTPVETWANYVRTESQWGPFGGETCRYAPPRSDCVQAGGQAQNVLASYHTSILGAYAGVTPYWQNQGCYTDIGMHLGYRFVLTSASYSPTISPGGTLTLEVSLVNRGYAGLYIQRPVYAVLDGPGGRFELPMPSTVDPRFWAGGSTQTFSANLQVPANIPQGNYRLSLWLPDPSPTLRSDPLYAIQMANTGIWDATYGLNVIASNVAVGPATAAVNAPPTVAVAAPATNTTVTTGSSVQLSATAADKDGSVIKVEFYANSALIGTAAVNGGQWIYTWPVSTAGTYQITAKAYDNSGASATSAPINLIVQAPAPAPVNQPPAVAITSPASGASFTSGATITMTAVASDPDGTISAVRFYNGSALLGSAAQAGGQWTFSLANAQPGTYNLTAVAVDNSGATTTSAAVTVGVQSPPQTNRAPSVMLTSPASGSSFPSGSTITLKAAASDPDGTVAAVRFYNGSTLLGSGTLSSGQWSLTLPRVAPGWYSFTAVAIDNAGATATSAASTVRVRNPRYFK